MTVYILSHEQSTAGYSFDVRRASSDGFTQETDIIKDLFIGEFLDIYSSPSPERYLRLRKNYTKKDLFDI